MPYFGDLSQKQKEEIYWSVAAMVFTIISAIVLAYARGAVFE